MSWHCLWQSCLLQNSTGIPAPFETFLWLALRRGPIFGAVGLHAFCLPSLRTLHVKPASWQQAQENMNGRCNLSQLNALFAEGKTHTPWAQNWDHTFGSSAANFSIVAPFLGPESGPCFGATKHKQELVNAGSKCATYCRRKLTAAHIRDTPRVHARGACFTTYLRLRFWGLGPT